mmetsp:Transcript_22749/g.58002  ORF Transcript_22749/g.58002 Transcript_22749/m.58002 type:complete len:432 (-) Transcript_22749:144-1439(-)
MPAHRCLLLSDGDLAACVLPRGRICRGVHCCSVDSISRGWEAQRRIGLIGWNVNALRRADAHTFTQWQAPHVVEGVQCELAPSNVELNLWCLDIAAVQKVASFPGQQLRDLPIERGGDAKVGSAGVHDAAAGTILADIQLDTVDADCRDVNLPVAKISHGDRRPGQRVQHALLVYAAHRDLTSLIILTLREEDTKVGSADLAMANEHVEGTEVLVHRQAIQAQAEDAVEVEGLERLLRHLDSHDHAHDAAGRLSLSACSSLKRATGTDPLVRELACDRASAKANGDLVAELAGQHHGAVHVDRRGRLRGRHVVPPVDLAGLAGALLRGQDHVAGARVEDDAEHLRGRAHADLAGVGGLVGDHGPPAVHGNGLAPQLDQVELVLRARGTRADHGPAQDQRGGEESDASGRHRRHARSVQEVVQARTVLSRSV